MESDRRQAAILLLDLTFQDPWRDEDLALALGSYPEAAAAGAYLVGFLVQILALHRGEDVGNTTRFIRHLLDRGDEGSGGTREPRLPKPTPLS
jgi:hypothetical protein